MTQRGSSGKSAVAPLGIGSGTQVSQVHQEIPALVGECPTVLLLRVPLPRRRTATLVNSRIVVSFTVPVGRLQNVCI
jgi:hypothetical protein